MGNLRVTVNQYNNGPLPELLEAAAYYTGHEFALCKADALLYLAWCQEHGLEVTGFEVWLPTTPGPTVYRFVDQGDATHCAGVIETMDETKLNKPSDQDFVYNIWVADTEESEC